MGTCLLKHGGTGTTTTMRFILLVAIFCMLCFNNVLGNPVPDNDVHFHVNMGSKRGPAAKKGNKIGEKGRDYANDEYSYEYRDELTTAELRRAAHTGGRPLRVRG